jgi:Na+/proline symporter
MDTGECQEFENLIYQNIIETQNTQADFMKWKLIASAAIGAAAMGLYSQQGAAGIDRLKYLIFLIPLVCAYVDAMFIHLWFRITIIGKYFREYSCGGFGKYEKAINDYRNLKNVFFSFERRMVFISSITLNLLVLVFGCITDGCKWQNDKMLTYILFSSAGIFFTVFCWYLATRGDDNW